MKIALPIRSIGWRGGDNYVRSLRVALKEISHENKRIKLIDYHRVDKWLTPLTFLIPNRIETIIKRQVYGHLGVNLPWSLVRYKRRPTYWIPDLQDIELPHFFDDAEIQKRERQRNEVIRKEGIFYFSSSSSLSIFQSRYPQAHVGGFVRFTSSLDENESLNHQKLEIDCKNCQELGYFYVPNQWWMHKNHLLAIDAFKEYQQSGGQRHLIFSGNEYDFRNLSYRNEILSSLVELGATAHNFGEVEFNQQRLIFNSSKVILQLSGYEGWSTVVEEALRLGKPLVVSNLKIHEEQVSGEAGALVVDPTDKEGVVRAMFNAESMPENPENTYFLRKERFKTDLINLLIRVEKHQMRWWERVIPRKRLE